MLFYIAIKQLKKRHLQKYAVDLVVLNQIKLHIKKLKKLDSTFTRLHLHLHLPNLKNIFTYDKLDNVK